MKLDIQNEVLGIINALAVMSASDNNTSEEVMKLSLAFLNTSRKLREYADLLEYTEGR